MTLLFFFFYKGINSITADESSPLVPTRCLLFVVTNGNLTVLFFTKELIQLELTNHHHLFPQDVCFFLVTNANLTLLFSTCVFHKGVNSIKADESSPLVPRKCLNKQNEMLLFLVTNGNSTLLLFYMGVNSIRADNLSPLVPRLEANIFGQFLCVRSSSLISLIHGYFMTFLSVRFFFS